MNVGLVGAGNISDTHARAALAAGLQIAGVYGDNHGKARQLAERYGAAAFSTLDALFAHPSLEMVIIGSPSGCHAQQAIAAARSGRHVLVEKPLDISTARIDRLLEEVTRAGVLCGVCFQDRLKPAVVDMKRRIDAGEIGTLLLATGEVKWFRPPEYYSTSRWRGTWAFDGGGALMNQGIHSVDLMLYLLGEIRSVSGLTSTRFHEIEAEDTATVLVEFVNGAHGTLDVTTAAYPGAPRRFRITGSKGSLWLEGDQLLDTSAPPQKAQMTQREGVPENAVSATVSDASAHQRIIEDFADAIRGGRRPICDGAEGRRSVAVVEAVYRSAREKTPIALISA